MRRVIIIVGLCVLALAVTWSVWCRRVSIPRTPVTAAVLSVTNDASGMRHATFQLANEGGSPVVLLAIVGLQNRLGFWRTNQVPSNAAFQSTNMGGILPFHPRVRSLQPGESYEVTLALPFDGDRWRASFWYIESQRPLEGALKSWSKLIGLPGKEAGQTIAYTDWSDQ
jgi:hypothetical protein